MRPDDERLRLHVCDTVERITGRPSYMASDEEWAAAEAEAELTYQPPRPLTPIEDAVRRASGRLTGEEVVALISAFNAARVREGGDTNAQ